MGWAFGGFSSNPFIGCCREHMIGCIEMASVLQIARNSWPFSASESSFFIALDFVGINRILHYFIQNEIVLIATAKSARIRALLQFHFQVLHCFISQALPE
jgi:hypothetical protein